MCGLSVSDSNYHTIQWAIVCELYGPSFFSTGSLIARFRRGRGIVGPSLVTRGRLRGGADFFRHHHTAMLSGRRWSSSASAELELCHASALVLIRIGRIAQQGARSTTFLVFRDDWRWFVFRPSSLLAIMAGSAAILWCFPSPVLLGSRGPDDGFMAKRPARRLQQVRLDLSIPGV